MSLPLEIRKGHNPPLSPNSAEADQLPTFKEAFDLFNKNCNLYPVDLYLQKLQEKGYDGLIEWCKNKENSLYYLWSAAAIVVQAVQQGRSLTTKEKVDIAQLTKAAAKEWRTYLADHVDEWYAEVATLYAADRATAAVAEVKTED